MTGNTEMVEGVAQRWWPCIPRLAHCVPGLLSTWGALPAQVPTVTIDSATRPTLLRKVILRVLDFER